MRLLRTVVWCSDSSPETLGAIATISTWFDDKLMAAVLRRARGPIPLSGTAIRSIAGHYWCGGQVIGPTRRRRVAALHRDRA